jgi:signal peptidase
MITQNGNRPRNLRKFTRTLRGVIDTILIMIIISASLLLVTPRVMGANLLVVVSQSMEPTVPMGSIVVSQPIMGEDEIEVGDVITFSVAELDGETVFVTHRVVEVIGNGADMRYRTQGDGVNETDMILVTPDQIVGEMWFSLPLVGYLVAFFRTTLGYVTLVGFPALLFVFHEWWEILRLRRERKSTQRSAISRQPSAINSTTVL